MRYRWIRLGSADTQFRFQRDLGVEAFHGCQSALRGGWLWRRFGDFLASEATNCYILSPSSVFYLLTWAHSLDSLQQLLAENQGVASQELGGGEAAGVFALKFEDAEGAVAAGDNDT